MTAREPERDRHQLGPDEAIGNRLPGSVNFLVRDEDLAARRCDRAWAVYEQS